MLLLSSAGILAPGVAAFVVIDPSPTDTGALFRSSAQRQVDDLLGWIPWGLSGMGGAGVVLALTGLFTRT